MQEEHTNQLDPDEPHTPGWLTLLGVGLFLGAGIFFLATGGDEEPTPATEKGDQNAEQQEPDPSEAAPAPEE